MHLARSIAVLRPSRFRRRHETIAKQQPTVHLRHGAVSLGIARALALGAIVATTPIAAAPIANLRGTMRTWQIDARFAHDMLIGRTTFDPSAISKALQTYIDDAQRIGQQLNERTADARDFKQRFVAFRADAQAALADLGQRSRLAADVSRVFSDCQSCHHEFNN
jgi:cytochrome c556